MDVFHLQGSITLDTSGFSQKVEETKKGFAGIASAANSAKKSAAEYTSDAMKLAATLRKEGVPKSEALKKAYASLDRSLYDLKETTKKAGSSFKESGNGIDYFKSKISALDVAIGNLLAQGISRLVSGLGSFVVSVVETSATVQAEEAQFEAAFGAVAGVAEDAFDRVGESTNILSTRLRTVGTKAFMQFSGAGIDTAESMEMMEEYLGLAADAAAAYDISLEEADTRLRSFLRGNTEAGDMINLFTSETQRNTYAMEKYGTSWLNLTEAQKQMLMLDVVRDIYDQSNVIGHAAKEGEEYSNVMQNFQETIEQTKKTIGAPITAAFTDFIAKITDFLSDEGLQEDLEHFSFLLGGIADAAFDGIIGFFETMMSEETAKNIKSIGSNISSFANDVSTLVGDGGILTVATGALVGFFAAMHPGLLVISGIAIVIAKWDEVKKLVSDAWDAIVGFFSETVPEAWTSAMETVSGWWNSITGGINNAIQAVKEFFGLQGGSGSGVHASYGEIKGGGSGASFAAYSELGDTMGVGGLRGYATGLPNVPYNNFVARLHEGERVLTKAENAAYSSRARNTGGESSNLAEAIAAAVVSAMSGMQVSMDGQRVGDIVTDRVSRNIAQAAYVGRFG